MHNEAFICVRIYQRAGDNLLDDEEALVVLGSNSITLAGTAVGDEERPADGK